MKRFQNTTKLPAFLAAWLACAGLVHAEKYALLVAIDDYSGVPGARNLPGCGDDLEGVKKFLTGTLGYAAANVISLKDGRATKASVLKELNAMVDKAQAGDAVVFYYSGHGGQVPDLNDDDETSDGLDEALITSDFDPSSEATWLLDDHLRASLSRLKTKRAMVLVDACHSGTGTRGNVVNKKAEFGFAKMLGRGRLDKSEMEESKAGPDTHVLISGCAANEVSALGVYEGKSGSLFTTALLNVLPRMLSAPLVELQAALHKEMARLAPDVAEEQNPQLETKITASFGDLVGNGNASPAASEPNNAPPVQQPSDGLPSAFPVQVIADKRNYMPEELMVATVVSDKPGFLRLYYVDKSGDATLIFPNFYQKDNQIEARQRIEVGGKGSQFAFRMKAPEGTEMLLAAVSETQFTDGDAPDLTKESPVKEMGKVDSVRKLMDTGTKQINVEGRDDGNPRPAQIGRSVCFYDIHDAAKSADAIVKQIQVEGRADFNEDALPFKFDSIDLVTEVAQSQLVQIARALQSPQLKSAKFLIEGHTCDLGEVSYNADLSKRRAGAIKAFLNRAGIGDDRLTIVGLGETKPAVEGSTEAIRAKNRRVELKLVK